MKKCHLLMRFTWGSLIIDSRPYGVEDFFYQKSVTIEGEGQRLFKIVWRHIRTTFPISKLNKFKISIQVSKRFEVKHIWCHVILAVTSFMDDPMFEIKSSKTFKRWKSNFYEILFFQRRATCHKQERGVLQDLQRP